MTSADERVKMISVMSFEFLGSEISGFMIVVWFLTSTRLCKVCL